MLGIESSSASTALATCADPADPSQNPGLVLSISSSLSTPAAPLAATGPVQALQGCQGGLCSAVLSVSEKGGGLALPPGF